MVSMFFEPKKGYRLIKGEVPENEEVLVPIGESEQFVAAMEAAGRPVDFVAVLGAEHGFDALSSPVSRTTAAVIRDWLRRTVLDP